MTEPVQLRHDAFTKVPPFAVLLLNMMETLEAQRSAFRAALIDRHGFPLFELGKSLFFDSADFRRFLMGIYPELPLSVSEMVEHDRYREVAGALETRLAILRVVLEGWPAGADAKDCFKFFCRAYHSLDSTKEFKAPKRIRRKAVVPAQIVYLRNLRRDDLDSPLSPSRIDRSELLEKMREMLRTYSRVLFVTIDDLNPWFGENVPDDILAILGQVRIMVNPREALVTPVKLLP